MPNEVQLPENDVPQTEEVKTPEDVIQDYALTGSDEYVPAAWAFVSSNLQKMEKIAADLKKYSPPTLSEVYAHIKANPNSNEALKLIAERLNALHADIRKLQEKATEVAREELTPEALPEEDLSKMRQQFDKVRLEVKGQIDSVETYVDTMVSTGIRPELKPVGEAFGELKLPQFRTGTPGSTSGGPSESQKIREWAKDNYVGEVPARGRIPQAVQDAYNKAQSVTTAE